MEEKRKQTETKKIVIGIICLAIVAVALFAVWKVLSPQGTAGEKRLTVQVVHKDGGSRAFDLMTDEEYLGPALVEGGVVVENREAYGLYILTADGETADEAAQEWWKLTKDGELLNTGADETPIVDGERYELTLTVGYGGF